MGRKFHRGVAPSHDRERQRERGQERRGEKRTENEDDEEAEEVNEGREANSTGRGYGARGSVDEEEERKEEKGWLGPVTRCWRRMLRCMPEN